MLRPDTLKREHQRGAFTVVELLVVIAIIAALAIVSLPAIKGLTQSHSVANASQQLLDDLALARQYAINNRSVVHVLFVPPSITNATVMTFPTGQDLPKRLMTGVYSTYAIYAERTVGDQPGQPRARYLSKWKSLPEGVFIAPREFTEIPLRNWNAQLNPLNRPFLYTQGFPFPTLTNALQKLPRIAFDPQGRVLAPDPVGNPTYRDEIIELARGSILASRDNNGDLQYLDVRESPPDNSIKNYNRIRIDGLTGRAILERPEVGQPQP
jgi:Tfp pilus assembly protein PilE